MAEDTWEIDPLKFTLNDLETLEKGLKRDCTFTELKATLARIVTNKTADEIGAIPLEELLDHMEKLTETVQELSVPKASATP